MIDLTELKQVNTVTTKQPLVSVITPAYNAAGVIGETIESVQKQTYTNWEMLIVDDCSTDETREIIRTYAAEDSRIRLIELVVNSGAAVARNTALEQAAGTYAAFLDSDDQWLPHKTERQLAWMQKYGAAFTFSQYYVIDSDGTNLGLGDLIPARVGYRDLLKQNMIGCLTVMVDLEQTGPLKMLDIRTRQDYVLWLELCRRGFTAYGISEPLAVYRRQKASISSDKKKMAKQNWKVYRDIEKLNLLTSSYYFMHYAWNKWKKYRRASTSGNGGVK
ncbi:glycosyltransferase family 2 protein [Bacillus daqingensis]|uniref:glycosyltransferase family 2 protein n=1 Tax=Bacillus daqingensis TaxID=872396 RepID=UPI003F86BFB0